MKKNTIYKIIKLFKISLLFSCSFYSKSNNTEAISELKPSSVEIKKGSIKRVENLENIQKLQNPQLLQSEKETVIKKITKELNENEKLIQTLGPNIEIFAQKINTDIQKIEPVDQFGINKKTVPENKDHNIDLILQNNLIRRLFYSSLNYDENKIKKLAAILAQTSSSNGYHYSLVGSIFWTGFKIQESLEKAVNLLTKNEQRRLMFNFKTKTVKNVKENFEKLINERNEWITTVENIISEYDNNKAGIKSNGIILSEIIRLGYETKFNPDESLKNLTNIQTILKACCDHTHY
ncbi:complement regulator-acquiring protein [Borreliella lusitaniae]|uniref:Complement regulator-acquiring protein n=1 Tax=Borreliella lusitaniae TaxID=100177 RepID=A0ABZ0CIY5_9SPIR|nr:complement regulator-acquiring protein [Borreliella lusitaniae]WNY69180.1 complement regulator-acquiring protein [Borreliella lusitaniae]